jgi:hypothetical protein
LNRDLNLAADTWGESRAGNDRFDSVGPLSVWIEVDSDDRTVTILAVGFPRRRPPA